MTKLEFLMQKSAGWAMPKKGKKKPQKPQKPKKSQRLGHERMNMKCIDCKMYDPLEGCRADNPGEDCAQIEYEMAVEMQEYNEMYEPTYNPEDGSM
jgi:hypothetical protein